MTGQEKIRRAYRVYVRQMPDVQATYQVSYVPRGLQQVRSAAKRVPEFKATAKVEDDEVAVKWQKVIMTLN